MSAILDLPYRIAGEPVRGDATPDVRDRRAQGRAAIAAGTPLVLKPTEKTPLTAFRLVELLLEAGLVGLRNTPRRGIRRFGASRVGADRIGIHGIAAD